MARREFDKHDVEAEGQAVTKLNALRPEHHNQRLSKRLAGNAKRVLEVKL